MLEIKKQLRQIEQLNEELKKEGFRYPKYYLKHIKKLFIAVYPEQKFRREYRDDFMYSIEAVYNGKKSRIYTNNLEDQDEMIQILKETAEVYGKSDQICNLYTERKIGKDVFSWDSSEKVYDVLRQAMKMAETSPLIYYVSRCCYEQNRQEIWMIDEQMNTICETDGYHCFRFGAGAQKKKTRSSVSDCIYGKSLYDMNVEDCVKKVICEAEHSLGGDQLPSGVYPVIFSGKVAAELLEAFLPAFYADNIQSKRSPLKEKQKSRIASSGLWIKEIPQFIKGRNCRSMDDEGILVSQKEIVENGIFLKPFYNQKTALKDGVKSTGNGFRPSIQEDVGTGVTNVILGMDSENTDSRSGLEEKMREGILITHVDGVFAGTNSATGNFSLIVGGRVIKNGKEENTFREVTMSGNFFEVLKQIKKTGDNLYITEPGSKSVLAPDLLTGTVTISGK